MPSEVMIDDLAFIPILFLSSLNLVSSRVAGWEQNVLDVHPSRFISVSR